MAYYIDSSAANDLGTGTALSPWKYIKTHVASLLPGDVVYLRGGTKASRKVYSEDNILISSGNGCANGTAVNPITIKPYTGEWVKLTSPTGGAKTIEISGRQYWVFDGDNSVLGANEYGIELDRAQVYGFAVWLHASAQYNTFRYMEIHNGYYDTLVKLQEASYNTFSHIAGYDNWYEAATDAHIFFLERTAAGATSDYNVFEYLDISDAAGDGIVADANNQSQPNFNGNIVRYGTFRATVSGRNSRHIDASYGENAIDLKAGENWDVHNLTVSGYRWTDTTHGGSGQGNQAAGITCHIQFDSGTFSWIKFTDCSGAQIWTARSTTIHHCEFYNAGYQGSLDFNCHVYVSSGTCNIYNSVFNGKPGASHNPIRADTGKGSTTTIKNCTFKSTGSFSWGAGNSQAYDHNGWYSCDQTLTGTGDVTSAPLYTNEGAYDFTLQAGSPLINAGTVIAGVTDGYSGAAPDIGAYEYVDAYVPPDIFGGAPFSSTSQTVTPSNGVRLSVYSTGTTLAFDANYLARAQALKFSSCYPGGLFSSLSCFIPCDPAAPFPFAAGQRIVARNGIAICWEGLITGLGYTVGQGGEQGVQLTAAGYWGQLFERRYWEKRWADNRITDAAWPWQTGVAGAEKCSSDRTARIRLTPKGVAWLNNEYAYLKYSMPTGELVKRVTCAYNLQEGGQAWRLAMGDHALSVTLWSITASGTGTQDVTLGTPDAAITLLFQAQAGQTPVEDGTYFGEVSSVVVYSETGTITAQSVTKNVRAKVTELNADETQIGAPGFTLVPFMTQGRESLASILMRAAAYGDTSYNSWAPYLLESDRSSTPDGKPVLALSQYPVLTTYDYAVRLDDPNLLGPLTVVYDLDSVRNWIAVRYRDQLDNRDVLITPDDDVSLKDTSSISSYGQREEVVDAGVTSAATATQLGRRVLARKKTPRYYVSGPVTVKGYIRTPGGARVPASQIRAGQRLGIENYLAGLIFLITGTEYDDSAETCAMSTGVPDDLAVFLAQLALRTA